MATRSGAAGRSSRGTRAGRRGKARRAPRRRLAPAERRAELLTAALEVFTEEGFERATLEGVAARAGATKGAVYHYFDSKEQLFLELMRDRMSAQLEARRALVAAAGPRRPRKELLRALLEGMWVSFQEPGQLDLMRLILTELPKFPEVAAQFFREIVAPARGTLRQALAVGAATNPETEPVLDAIASTLASMMIGACLTRHLYQDVDPRPIGDDEAGAVVTRTLLEGSLAALSRGPRRPASTQSRVGSIVAGRRKPPG